jgi:hypothetical protein
MYGSRWNLKQEDTDELAIFSGRTRFVSSKRGSQSPGPFPPPIETNYRPTRPDAEPLSAAPSYYSETSMSSSSPISNWASEARRDEYIEPRREQYIPTQDRHLSQQYQPISHYRTQEQVPVPAPVSYQWQQGHTMPPQYYGGQMVVDQPYAPPAHHDNYRQQQQQQLFTPNFQTGHQPLPPPSELADLGLAARDSRLDERWSSFMQDSGLLDEENFTHNRGR